MNIDQVEIKIIKTVEDLPYRSPIIKKGQIIKWGNPFSTNTVIMCDQRVIRKTKLFSQSTMREVGGILIGEAFQDEGLIYIHIIDFIHAPVFSAEQSSSVHFNFTPDTWLEMLKMKDQHYDNLRVVGWFHSHPNHGVFLSSLDLNIHEGHFTSIWHTAMVYDPVRDEGGFFIWAENKVIESSGFIEIVEQTNNESLLPWKNIQRDQSTEFDSKPDALRRSESQRALNILSISMVIVTAVFLFLAINSIYNLELKIHDHSRRLDLLNVHVQDLITAEKLSSNQETLIDNSSVNEEEVDMDKSGLSIEMEENKQLNSIQNGHLFFFLKNQSIYQQDLSLFDTDFIR